MFAILAPPIISRTFATVCGIFDSAAVSTGGALLGADVDGADGDEEVGAGDEVAGVLDQRVADGGAPRAHSHEGDDDAALVSARRLVVALEYRLGCKLGVASAIANMSEAVART